MVKRMITVDYYITAAIKAIAVISVSWAISVIEAL